MARAWLLLTTLYSVVLGSELECSSQLQFTVTSRRNQSGHWVAEVQVEQHAGPWEIRIKQSECSGVMRLHATVTHGDADTPTAPSDDYYLVAGVGRYKLNTTALTWEEARSTCESEGAHLLVLDSPAELSIVKQMFTQAPDIRNSSWSDMAWVGMHDMFAEGKYVTVLGHSYKTEDFVKWSSGDQNRRPDLARDDCVGVERDGELFDTSCSSRLAFFCERAL